MKREVEIEYAPKDEEDFKEWCKKLGFNYLGGSRRAWCNQFHTYFRDSIGIVVTNGGEEFLINDYDINSNKRI